MHKILVNRQSTYGESIPFQPPENILSILKRDQEEEEEDGHVVRAAEEQQQQELATSSGLYDRNWLLT